MRILLFLLLLSANCVAQLPLGNWRAIIKLNDTLELPFNFSAEDNIITIQNGEEGIDVDDIIFKKDSVFIQMPVFDSEFKCKLEGNELKGVFINNARKTQNVFRFQARNGVNFRFSDKPLPAEATISGSYHVIFDGEDEESKDAIGVFKQIGNKLRGTFLTTTGDYRFLEGELNGNRIWLSAFDGSHLFLFSGIVSGDSILKGEFFSGQHWYDTWKGWRDENFKIANPDSLTFLKSSQDKIAFTFRDENHKNVSLSDERFKNKAIIVQIMGTWCPNCLDETKFLAQWYFRNKNMNVAVIALDYEKIPDTTHAYRNIRRLKERYGIEYPVLFAGSSDKKEASQTLPMLNRVFAYPTLIFLNKEKKVVNIHTGFSGPATGEAYSEFIRHFLSLVNRLAE